MVVWEVGEDVEEYVMCDGEAGVGGAEDDDGVGRGGWCRHCEYVCVEVSYGCGYG